MVDRERPARHLPPAPAGGRPGWGAGEVVRAEPRMVGSTAESTGGMTTNPQGFPDDLVAVDVGASSVSLRVDPATYPLDALYGAAYIFIDRCYVAARQARTRATA